MAEDEIAPGRMLPQAVTVVIPAFNERPHVLAQVEDVEKTLRATDWDFEIIVVDDGSTDGTADEARKSSARVVSQRQNIGYGAAIRRGLAESRYDWILITDADGTYPTAAIPQLLAKAAENDMVVGARVGLNVRIPLVRKPAKAFLRWLASYLSGQHLPDLNSGLRLMRKSLLQRYEHLLPPGFSLTTTITMASACQAHPMEFVPIDYHARLGSSKIRPWHAYEFLILILRLSVLFNPLKVFMPIGAFIAAAGLAKFCYDLTLSNLSESAVLSLLAALLIWCVGLLADQSSRIAMHR